jgi:nucleoside-diphosphate-sugar epimerase
MKRALVTGGTGFIGANLVRRLLRDGHQVHLLVRPTHKSWRIADILPECRLQHAELADRTAVGQVLQRCKPEWIFHLAGYGGYHDEQDVGAMVATNITGLFNLREAALDVGFEAFINGGSSSEYGYKDHAPSETEHVDPNSDYAVTKAAATHLCRFTALSTGVRMITLRLYSVYGPYEEPTRFIPTLIREGLRGGFPPLVAPDTARDFVFVDDAVEAFICAATTSNQRPGAVYNVGTGVQTTIRAAVELCQKVLAIEGQPSWGTMPRHRWDTNVWVADAMVIRQALGWEPRTSFESGFRRTVEWAREHGDALAVRRSQRSPEAKARAG